MRNEEILKKIKEIESQLSQLRLELEKGEPDQKPPKTSKKKASLLLEIGDEVAILNPKKGQGRQGIITKVNALTGYGTVETVNDRNRTEKVVRKLKNLRRK